MCTVDWTRRCRPGVLLSCTNKTWRMNRFWSDSRNGLNVNTRHSHFQRKRETSHLNSAIIVAPAWMYITQVFLWRTVYFYLNGLIRWDMRWTAILRQLLWFTDLWVLCVACIYNCIDFSCFRLSIKVYTDSQGSTCTADLHLSEKRSPWKLEFIKRIYIFIDIL